MFPGGKERDQWHKWVNGIVRHVSLNIWNDLINFYGLDSKSNRSIFIERIQEALHSNVLQKAVIYLFNINNGNTWMTCEICSNLAIKTQERHHWHRSDAFNVNLEHISHMILEVPLLTLNKEMPTGNALKLVSAIFFQILICSSNDNPLKTMKNVFLLNLIFFSSIPHFPDSKGQMEVE